MSGECHWGLNQSMGAQPHTVLLHPLLTCCASGETRQNSAHGNKTTYRTVLTTEEEVDSHEPGVPGVECHRFCGWPEQQVGRYRDEQADHRRPLGPEPVEHGTGHEPHTQTHVQQRRHRLNWKFKCFSYITEYNLLFWESMSTVG